MSSINLTVILPIIISVFLGFVAFQQMRINKNKLRLDLYNKRFEVYTSALLFYQEVTSEGASKECHRDFISKKESAYFLFSDNPKIYDLLNTMHEKLFKISGFRSSAEQLKSFHDAFRKAQAESVEDLKCFSGITKILRQEMESYLSFDLKSAL